MALNSDSAGGQPRTTLYSGGASLEPYCEGWGTFPRVAWGIGREPNFQRPENSKIVSVQGWKESNRLSAGDVGWHHTQQRSYTNSIPLIHLNCVCPFTK